MIGSSRMKSGALYAVSVVFAIVPVLTVIVRMHETVSSPSLRFILLLSLSPLLAIVVARYAAKARVQQAATESELLRVCADSPNLYCVVDFSGTLIEVNEAARTKLAADGIDFSTINWYSMVHPDDLSQTVLTISILLASDAKVSSFRNRIRFSSDYRWMDWSAMSNFDARRLYIVGRDVTDEYNAFLALSDSEQRFRVTLDSIHEGLIVAAADGRVTLINRSALQILTIDEGDLKGHSIIGAEWEIIREDGSRMSPDENPLAVALMTGKPQPDLVLGFHSKKGELRWIKANAIPLFHEGDKTPYAAVSRLSDVTENREVDDQIQSYMVALENQKEELELANVQLEKANDLLQTLATTDALTGLHNHRAFQERLVEEIMRSERYKTPLSLILLDVDDFKRYNDTFGHPAGDEVLHRLADILREHGRTHDLAARYGGEEFVLLTPHTDLDGATVLAERCRAAIERVPWPARSITASFGIASLGEGITTGRNLIACADQALYAAKASGRNRVSVYETALHEF
jgi:diguanylate cyclase (GGDEF)-like protein/PAS domain S-box-containing protein